MTEDQERAAGLESHRAVLRRAGAGDLARRPWQHGAQPASDGDLVRLAAWRASDPAAEAEVVTAGLGLLHAAREELDQVEAALLFAARASGMTFQEIAAALGLGSGQAAQQRMARVLSRAAR
ncbi:hypothetical protein [Cellulomonas sp. IC4_254]|uniref:hypothetical protein n=1 Tax=Cellulomonas sp. IC4_254 TaxID=2714040 RepID=UPI001421B791|nr:hypothetical protein [Cellulomonas sp. IC4_254]NHT18381.1 hypothetical protein [Cellulomonas sp. IC4_254]